MIGSSLFAKEDKINPKEIGVYIKTDKGLKRLFPNIVFNDENGILFVAYNNPAHFL